MSATVLFGYTVSTLKSGGAAWDAPRHTYRPGWVVNVYDYEKVFELSSPVDCSIRVDVRLEYKQIQCIDSRSKLLINSIFAENKHYWLAVVAKDEERFTKFDWGLHVPWMTQLSYDGLIVPSETMDFCAERVAHRPPGRDLRGLRLNSVYIVLFFFK